MTQETLAGRGLTLGYDGRVISADLDVSIPPGSFTAIIGPNACGKSTLLRALSRLLSPTAGQVILDGRAITEYGSKEVARRLGLLPQSSVAPDGITVFELVSRGRFPHQSLLRQWSEADEAAVHDAMESTNVLHLADAQVDELSGGQRQRVWLALVLAQQTPLLLLDEPTTFLDIAHQIDVLNLCRSLHAHGSYTLVAVLHDLNMAFRYADHVIAMRDGRIIAQGAPADIVSAELVHEVFGLRAVCVDDPVTGKPMVVPLDAVPETPSDIQAGDGTWE
ncbi:ABC transporter ATP-binding protein [Paramicrobacterium agarici]|uniref:Iron complex transport system ATP-binding protein n=1 Tax=Paramicrobacterium agarici TaxID=630514 RepID=A0A2A9DS49_9MICO|nr:ABC transporter ATP-binding protein [Microbacterium agarici]PFG29186.1 iron complex transport system ATP-binding protein [Microbacterium agarici]TQO22150.1 iron complex transport system ATP-binding protein [Microbacterium agarici]